MEKLVVLDHSTNIIHVYNLDKEDFISEDYIQGLGFDVGNCSWLAGEIEIVKHKEILK